MEMEKRLWEGSCGDEGMLHVYLLAHPARLPGPAHARLSPVEGVWSPQGTQSSGAFLPDVDLFCVEVDHIVLKKGNKMWARERRNYY